MLNYLFSEMFIDAVNRQRSYYDSEREAADNAQAYYSNRGAADCCEFFAGYCKYLISMGITGRDTLVSRILDEVVLRIDLEKARYFGADSPSVYADAAGWGFALRWLNCLLIAYSDAPMLR